MAKISRGSAGESRSNTEGTEGTEFTERRFRVSGAGGLLMVALLAYREGDGKTVLFWREGAGGEGSVGAGGVLEAIEIEEEFAGVVEAMIGKGGIEKAAGAVGGGGAGGVAKDEE